MHLRRLLFALPLLLPSVACTTDPPTVPKRSFIRGGSDWITKGTRVSFQTGGAPVVIENAGSHDLRIGSGPDAILLPPGATYETDGAEIEVFNPGDNRSRVVFRPPAGAPPGATIEVIQKRDGQTQRIRATHVSGTKPLQ
jgi:hypothetical protein